MDSLEELANDDEIIVQTLVAISICEQLLGNQPEQLPALLPFMGARLRADCRGFFSSLRVSDENKRLLNRATERHNPKISADWHTAKKRDGKSAIALSLLALR